MKRLDLIGKKFGRWVVLKDVGNDKWGASQWLCVCGECSNKKIVSRSNLVKGSSKSCGCLQKELVGKMSKQFIGENNPNYGNGEKIRGTRNPNYRNGLKISGPNNPNWKGGISCDPYCDAWADKEYKKDIKARDNYECQNPICWGSSNRLDIHHIDYNKQNCHPDNLITLCVSCNSRANFKRDYWQNLYKNLMLDRRTATCQ